LRERLYTPETFPEALYRLKEGQEQVFQKKKKKKKKKSLEMQVER